MYEYRKANREIVNASVRRVHDRNKATIAKIKSTAGCYRCGFSDPRALEFHHRDPADKEYTLSQIATFRWGRIEAEIAKCDVICANCHRILHAEEVEAKLRVA